VAKKKISFDIEIEDFNKIKLLIERKQMGQGDFLRQATRDLISKFEENLIDIYVFTGCSIKKFLINENDFDIEIYTASQDTQELTGAKKEGIIKNKNNIIKNNELSILISENQNQKINFYIKE